MGKSLKSINCITWQLMLESTNSTWKHHTCRYMSLVALLHRDHLLLILNCYIKPNAPFFITVSLHSYCWKLSFKRHLKQSAWLPRSRVEESDLSCLQPIGSGAASPPTNIQYGRCSVNVGVRCCLVSHCIKHVGRTFHEELCEQAASQSLSAGCRLLLSHRERCLRIPTQATREGAQVAERPPRGSKSRSVRGYFNVTIWTT